MELPSATDISTPMRRIRPACCARAASGHVAAAPPSNVMNSRRLMSKTDFSSAVGLQRQPAIGMAAESYGRT
jgi:hypothetical protein